MKGKGAKVVSEVVSMWGKGANVVRNNQLLYTLYSNDIDHPCVTRGHNSALSGK
jgi:hypothetical protein